MNILRLFVLTLILTSSVFAYDIEVGRQSGLGGGILFSSLTASDFLSCPIGLLPERHIIFESGYQRRFELSDLDKVFISAAYRLGNLSTSIGFSQFGRKDYYVEQSVKSAISYKYGSYTASILISSRLIEINTSTGELTLKAISYGLAGGVNYRKYHLGIVIDNINRPKLYDKDEKEHILYNFYGEIEGSERFSMTGRLTLEQNEKPILAIGQYIKLTGRNAIFWGVSNNPLTYGGGIEVHRSKYGLIYAVSYHPVLGFTHNVSLNFTIRL